MAANDWKRRWQAITDKFNLHVIANKKVKAENAELRKARPVVDFLNVCSFCGHSRDDIDGSLIIGPHVSICFSCVETAKSVVKHEKHGPDSDTCTCGYDSIRVHIDQHCPHHKGS